MALVRPSVTRAARLGVGRQPRRPQTFFDAFRGKLATIAIPGDSFGNDVDASTAAKGWSSIVCARMGATRAQHSVNGSVLQNSNDASAAPRADNLRDNYLTLLTGGNAASFAWIPRVFNDARYIGAPSTFNVAAWEGDANEIVAGLIASGAYTARTLGISAPWWISDTGLVTHFGDANFAGQTRAGFVAFAEAARRVARRHKLWFADAYNRIAPMGAAAVGPDNIHYNDAGHAALAEVFLSATRLGV